MSFKTLLFGVVAFKTTWLGCVWLAAQGRVLEGAVVGLLGTSIQLVRRPRLMRELGTVAAVGVAGMLVDGLLARWTGLWELRGTVPFGLVMAWWFAMWSNFTAALGLAFSPLRARLGLAAVAGLIGGPAAYLGGASMGAVELGSQVSAMIALAIIWGVAFPGLHRLRDRVLAVDA